MRTIISGNLKPGLSGKPVFGADGRGLWPVSLDYLSLAGVSPASLPPGFCLGGSLFRSRLNPHLRQSARLCRSFTGAASRCGAGSILSLRSCAISPGWAGLGRASFCPVADRSIRLKGPRVACDPRLMAAVFRSAGKGVLRPSLPPRAGPVLFGLPPFLFSAMPGHVLRCRCWRRLTRVPQPLAVGECQPVHANYLPEGPAQAGLAWGTPLSCWCRPTAQR